jgi:putative aminopeptidase
VCAQSASAANPPVPGDLASDLKEFVETPSVSGYESELGEKIRAKLAAFHPVVDNLGDVIVTVGTGSPRRLIVTPIDEPGFVVSGITDDGYLRLQRLPQGVLPPIFNTLYSAQPVKVRTASGKWIDGVVAGISVHLHRVGQPYPDPSDIENMYVDIGATSAAEVRKAGVDILSPIAINRSLLNLSDSMLAGASIGDKFGAWVLVELLHDIDLQDVKGTLTVAFVTQQRVGGRGLDRILRSTQADEMIYVGRMLPGGNVPGMEGMHRAPRREPGSGVLIGLQSTGGELTGLAAELKKLAGEMPFETDYSAGIGPSGYLPPPVFPPQWVHMGVAIAWPDTPAETVKAIDAVRLIPLLTKYLAVPFQPPMGILDNSVHISFPAPVTAAPPVVALLNALVEKYGASGHEGPVRAEVNRLLPSWAKPETDDAGNLILHVGTAPAGSKSPKILIDAHMDEIGFEVKSISKDGRLECETLGGMEMDFYQGHPMLVHTTTGDRAAIMELPNGWDEPNFKWPTGSDQPIRVDVGARNADEVSKLGIKPGDWVTIPKEYRPLLGTRANGRSFDDRVGDTALISAVWALGGPLKDRDVTFVWSTGEELGLLGAGAIAKRLAAEGRTPDYVFAVDTVVSSDSPIESKRYADAQIGKGFAIRAIDDSNLDPGPLVNRVEQLARANQIPFQVGITSGGNDGAMFVPYGSVNVALGWPLRYSHSPAEVIDTRDVDALARIITVIARSW